MAGQQDFTKDIDDSNASFHEGAIKNEQFENSEGNGLFESAGDCPLNGEEGGGLPHNSENMEQTDSLVNEDSSAAKYSDDQWLNNNVTDSGSAELPGKDDDRKLFVGGLSWETTEKDLREYFGKYGEIESVNVKTDPNTGRSRGFAFVVFKSVEAIDGVMAILDHLINGKKVDPKKAKAKQGKIFVGGLSPELSDDDVKNHFAQYGAIAEVEMPFDKQKNQRKGFCFITYESEAVVTELLKNPKHTLGGKEVDLKKATPKPNQGVLVRGGRGNGRGAPRGRGSRGRGNWSQGWNGPGYGSYPYSYGYNGYDYGYNGGYGGYDYYGNCSYGYGPYDNGYSYDQTSYNSRGSSSSMSKPQGSFGGRSRGGRQAQRHQPY